MVVYKMIRSRSVKRPKRVSRRRGNAGRTVSRRRNTKRLRLRQSKRVSKRINRNRRNNKRKSNKRRNKRSRRVIRGGGPGPEPEMVLPPAILPQYGTQGWDDKQLMDIMAQTELAEEAQSAAQKEKEANAHIRYQQDKRLGAPGTATGMYYGLGPGQHVDNKPIWELVIEDYYPKKTKQGPPYTAFKYRYNIDDTPTSDSAPGSRWFTFYELLLGCKHFFEPGDFEPNHTDFFTQEDGALWLSNKAREDKHADIDEIRALIMKNLDFFKDMMDRSAYQRPWIVADAETMFDNETLGHDRLEDVVLIAPLAGWRDNLAQHKGRPIRTYVDMKRSLESTNTRFAVGYWGHFGEGGQLPEDETTTQHELGLDLPPSPQEEIDRLARELDEWESDLQGAPSPSVEELQSLLKLLHDDKGMPTEYQGRVVVEVDTDKNLPPPYIDGRRGGRLGIIVDFNKMRVGHNIHSIQFGHPNHSEAEEYEFKGKNRTSYQIAGIIPPVE